MGVGTSGKLLWILGGIRNTSLILRKRSCSPHESPAWGYELMFRSSVLAVVVGVVGRWSINNDCQSIPFRYRYTSGT